MRNLTRHPVVLVSGDRRVVLSAEMPTPRVSEQPYDDGVVTVDGCSVPLVALRLGEVTDLPAPEDDTLLIVSRAVALACPNRSDLRVPVDDIRDEDGRVVGCRALARLLPAES